MWPPVSFLTKIRKHGEVGRVQTLKSDVGSVIPGGSDGKASVYNVRDLGSIPGLGRFPGEGNGSTLALKIPWTEELGAGYCPWDHKALVGHD